MTLSTQGAPYTGGNTGWMWDDAAGEFVPVIGNVPADLTRGIGRLTTVGLGAAAATASRSLVNQTLPPGILFSAGIPGVESNNFTARQAVTPATMSPGFNQASFGAAAFVANTIPAGALNLVGRNLRIRGAGTWGVTATPTFTFDLALGAVVIATTQAVALTAVASPQNFYFDVICQVSTAGAAGAINSGGLFTGQITSLTSFPLALSNSTPGTAATVDLTAAQLVTANVTWTVASASNRIRLFSLVAEILY